MGPFWPSRYLFLHPYFANFVPSIKVTPLFTFQLHDEKSAKDLPKHLKLFRDATSLGGVESLIDWRYKWDQTVSPRLLRVSIGLENFEDLQEDFSQAFKSYAKL